MIKSPQGEPKLISSKEVLEKTGVSRATLNNYIKMGILPRPVVHEPGEEQSGGPTRLGYFPEAVLKRIEVVKRLKKAGHSMEKIAHQLKRIPELDDPEKIVPKIAAGQPDLAMVEARIKIEDSNLQLNIENIPYPAYLINPNFEIEWINSEAEDLVFNKTVRTITRLESRNIFKLFFSWEFHEQLTNWEDIIAFHMNILKISLTKDRIAGLYDGISEKEQNYLEKIFDKKVAPTEVQRGHAQVVFAKRDDTPQPYQVYTVFFREGTFFVFVPSERQDHDVIEFLACRQKVINDILRRRMPSLVSLCVLVADLQDSVKISAELLPGEYFELINELWKCLADSFDKYSGIYGKHAGDGMLYYFIKKPGSNYIMDAIFCALEIREKMKGFSKDWKIKKRWLNDIYLNMGINEGQEFFGTVRSASNIEFTALGDSINYAGRLSDFARQGAIWTTKNLISKLDHEDLERIHFGTTRTEQDRDIFIENSFLRVIDVMDASQEKYKKFTDIATLPITEIVGPA